MECRAVRKQRKEKEREDSRGGIGFHAVKEMV